MSDGQKNGRVISGGHKNGETGSGDGNGKKSRKSPDTGDDSNPWIWAFLALAALTGIIKLQKAKNSTENDCS